MASKMNYVDTHCNLPNILRNLKLISNNFDKEQNFLQAWEIFQKEKLNPLGFEKAISVASDTETRTPTINLLSNDSVYGVFGIHPLYAKEYTLECEKKLLEVMKHPKTLAWGEIGLDYHKFEGYNYAEPPLQKQIFKTQMEHAISLNKPIVIHTREAEEDTFQMMKEFIPRHWKLHVHCFTDSIQFAQQLIQEYPNLYIGFTGVITFKHSTKLEEIVKSVPIDRIVLETDGPFMAPVPHRGKICHPGYIPIIAEHIAKLKSLSIDEPFFQTNLSLCAIFEVLLGGPHTTLLLLPFLKTQN